MLDLRIFEQGHEIPLFDLAAALGKPTAARTVADTVEALIAFLDDLGGDCDLEDSEAADTVDDRGRFSGWLDPRTEDDELAGDEEDASWPEGGSGRSALLSHRAAKHEDDEDDDAAEEDDHSGGNNAEDDFHMNYYASRGAGPGCPISDPGGDGISC